MAKCNVTSLPKKSNVKDKVKAKLAKWLNFEPETVSRDRLVELIEAEMSKEENQYRPGHLRLTEIINQNKYFELWRLNGKVRCCNGGKKDPDFWNLEEAISMLQYLSFYTPKTMDSLLNMQCKIQEARTFLSKDDLIKKPGFYHLLDKIPPEKNKEVARFLRDIINEEEKAPAGEVHP